MSDLSIRIKIADREYPMRVETEEEVRIRTAGKQLNDKLGNFRKKFNIDDKQDLLAMVAFDNQVHQLHKDEQIEHQEESLIERISNLSNLISQNL